MLLLGDCLELLPSLPDKSVDLVFCDLPYGQTNCKWDCKIDLNKLWIELMRVKKENTPLFFTTTTKFGVELIQSAPKKCPFRYDIVWMKSHKAGFFRSKFQPLRSHEMVYVFYERMPIYNIETYHKNKFVSNSLISVPKESNPSIYNNTNKTETPLTKHPVAVFGKSTGQPRYDPPLPDSILKINSTRGKHPTEKPVALMEWIIKYFSKENDLVLDPTMGSGSTGVACKNLNRKFIGMELDEEHYQVANQRIE